MDSFVRPAVLFFSLLLSSCSSSNEACSPEQIGLTESSNIAETLFYTGTCHYRNEEYEQSVEYWTRLSQLENIEPEYQELQISSLNNLGYMKFYGLGTAEDKDLAIDYWQQAILLGHEEAEYHLCHAFADKSETTYDRSRARSHCRKALLVYRGMEVPDEEILRDLEKYNAGLED